MKQSSLDDHESLGMELEGAMGSDNGDDNSELSEYDERRPADNSGADLYSNNYQNRPITPPPIPVPVPRGKFLSWGVPVLIYFAFAGLPWKPKVRQKDIDNFLDCARMKFVGYSLPGDRESLAGLPQPIHEGVKTLKEVRTGLA